MPQSHIESPHHVKGKTWTETVIFPLEKYSRANARPNLLPESTASTQSAPKPVNPVDWSHFNQPRLSLLLDTVHADSETVNRSENLALNHHQKVILKINWDSNSQSQQGHVSAPSATNDEPGVFQLEKINLTEIQESFGHLRMGEIPLKANCKDRVVAIRYATDHKGGLLMFNRIQIKLQTVVDCFKFIAILETICPCKMSSSTNQIQTSQDLRNTASSLPANFEPPDSLKSSQPPGDINTNMETSTELTRLDRPDLTSLQASHQEYETRESHIISQDGNRATPSCNRGMLPEGITDLNNLSDESLMVYVREIIMEPGFENLVKHLKSLIPQG